MIDDAGFVLWTDVVESPVWLAFVELFDRLTLESIDAPHPDTRRIVPMTDTANKLYTNFTGVSPFVLL